MVFPARSALFNHNILNTKAISHFQANHILIRFVFPPLYTPGTMSNADYTTPDMGQKYRSSKFIYNKIMEVEKKEGLNGHLMLIHFGTDNRRTDKFYNSYLDKLIKTLKRRGYTFTPILEAIGIKTNSAL